jgi:2-polyprenyl-3-methyl-5-hydroxy-6-metoxy-1,4-benzoquinol methylase
MTCDLNNVLLLAIKRANPRHGRIVDHAFTSLNPAEREMFEQYVNYCGTIGFGIERLATSYNMVVADTFKEEIYFRRHGRYRYSTYSEVAAAVYLNPEYMQDYMHGLAVTEFLWPNHVAIRRFFDELLASAPRGSHYLEIGPGHGFFLAQAIRARKWDNHHGVDISPTSLEMTRSILDSGVFGQLDNYVLYENDFLQHEFSTRYDAFVMGEVLEHVEDPPAFLRRIGAVTTEDPFVFLTTCINAPAVDHLSNLGTPEGLERMFQDAGLSIRHRLIVPYFGKTVDESLEEKLSINVAYCLGKGHGE